MQLGFENGWVIKSNSNARPKNLKCRFDLHLKIRPTPEGHMVELDVKNNTTYNKQCLKVFDPAKEIESPFHPNLVNDEDRQWAHFEKYVMESVLEITKSIGIEIAPCWLFQARPLKIEIKDSQPIAQTLLKGFDEFPESDIKKT